MRKKIQNDPQRGTLNAMFKNTLNCIHCLERFEKRMGVKDTNFRTLAASGEREKGVVLGRNTKRLQLRLCLLFKE